MVPDITRTLAAYANLHDLSELAEREFCPAFAGWLRAAVALVE